MKNHTTSNIPNGFAKRERAGQDNAEKKYFSVEWLNLWSNIVYDLQLRNSKEC